MEERYGKGLNRSMDVHALDRQYRMQAAWFAGERNRLLRKVDISSKRHVLDLGSGTGAVLGDLAWRCGGIAVGFDCSPNSLQLARGLRICGQAETLPFSDAAFDLVFTQMFFLWVADPRAVISEISRVLIPGGHLIAAAEPDYGGVIEHPPRADGMRAYGRSLQTEGADTEVARKLWAVLLAAGFEVSAGVHPCDPVSDAGETGNSMHKDVRGERGFAFLPYFSYVCRKPRLRFAEDDAGCAASSDGP